MLKPKTFHGLASAERPLINPFKGVTLPEMFGPAYGWFAGFATVFFLVVVVAGLYVWYLVSRIKAKYADQVAELEVKHIDKVIVTTGDEVHYSRLQAYCAIKADNPGASTRDIAKILNIHHSTLYHSLNYARERDWPTNGVKLPVQRED